MRRLSFLAGILSVVGGLQAATYYADASRVDDSGDGLTLVTAKRHIQAAVDLAAAGDTVLVAPGVYNEGTTRDTLSKGQNESRVVLNKAITLKSLQGKAVTHIVGAWDPAGDANGLGPNAIRCITSTDTTVAGTTIEGFTIRDGATHIDADGTTANANVSANWGGGVYGVGRTYVTVVDCTVQHCRATRGGGVGQASAVRTLFVDNYASSMGSAIRNSNAYNCIFTGQRGYTACGFDDLVNCTFAGNDNYSFYYESYGKSRVVNCVSVGNYVYDTYPDNIKGLILTNDVIWTFRDVDTLTFTTPPQNLTGLCGDPGVVFSPGTGDFRPAAGSCLIGAGSVEGLDLIPERYRDVDFNGNPRTTDGTVCLGAIETPAVPATQTLKFNFSSNVSNLYVNGVSVGRASWVNSETSPAQYEVKAEMVPGKELFCAASWPAGVYRFPKEDGTYRFVQLPVGGEQNVDVVTNFFLTATSVLWTDPTADSETADGTEAHPFRTLQDAADASPSGNNSKYILVHCKPGVYAEGGMTVSETVKSPISYAGTYVQTNRLYAGVRHIFFRSTEGAASTTLQGNWDTSENKLDDFGTGPAAVRCVQANSSGYIFALMGFTMKDGATVRLASDSTNKDYGGPAANGGAALFAAAASSAAATSRSFNHNLIDCVITHCSGSRGAAVNGGLVRRCRISDCHTTTSGSGWFRNACVASSVIEGGEISQTAWLWGQGGHYWNCTAYGTDAKSVPMHNGSYYYGCLFAGTAAAIYNPATGFEVKGCLNGTSYTKNVTAMTNADAKLTDAANGDYRPRADSPALGLLDPAQATNFYYMVEDDFDGRPLLVQNGRVAAGAYQKTVPVLSVTAISSGEIDQSGTIVVTNDSVTLSVSQASNRKFLGFAVGDDVTETAERTFTWTPDPDVVYTNALVARAVYATNWYVNAVSGLDTNDGWTPETARRTLVAGVADAVSGDVVHAAAGVYADNSALQTARYSKNYEPALASRVAVPAGVTLEGESAATTIIEGAPDPGTTDGMGANAVRGAWLDVGAKLRNFTIRNGYSNNGKLDRDDDCGGGVLMQSASTAADMPWVEDCVITNCVAGRGGGARFGHYNRVKFLGNKATVNGPAVREGRYYNCYMDNNVGSMLTLSFARMENCTFGPGNSTTVAAGASSANRVYNCVFMKKGNYNFCYVSNCVFVTGSTYTNRYTGVGNYVSPEGSNRTAELSEMKVTDGVPARDSVLVDAGDTSLDEGPLGTRDLTGNPRVSNNNRIDVGAFEYDWRPVYAKTLRPTGQVSVTAADPAVTLAADGTGVLIPAGASLMLDWTYVSSDGKKHLTADVAEGGTLEIARNGETAPLVTVAAGTSKLDVAPDHATDAYVFTAYDSSSVISSFLETFGTLIRVR